MVDLVLTAILKAPEAIILTVPKITSIITFEFETCSTLEQFTTRIWRTLSN